MFRPGVQIGEIATPSAGDEDLPANHRVVLQNNNAAAALAGLDGAHQAGGATANHRYIRGKGAHVAIVAERGGKTGDMLAGKRGTR